MTKVTYLEDSKKYRLEGDGYTSLIREEKFYGSVIYIDILEYESVDSLKHLLIDAFDDQHFHGMTVFKFHINGTSDYVVKPSRFNF